MIRSKGFFNGYLTTKSSHPESYPSQEAKRYTGSDPVNSIRCQNQSKITKGPLRS